MFLFRIDLFLSHFHIPISIFCWINFKHRLVSIAFLLSLPPSFSIKSVTYIMFIKWNFPLHYLLWWIDGFQWICINWQFFIPSSFNKLAQRTYLTLFLPLFHSIEFQRALLILFPIFSFSFPWWHMSHCFLLLSFPITLTISTYI